MSALSDLVGIGRTYQAGWLQTPLSTRDMSTICGRGRRLVADLGETLPDIAMVVPDNASV